jgi:hypothetical protein
MKALERIGGLSRTSKMPGWSYGLPARECHNGGTLRNTPNSVCAGCYAMRGNYRFPTVLNKQYQRLEAIKQDDWVDCMVTVLGAEVDPVNPYFRWHDSGDLQGVWHLEKVAEVARRLPWVKFYLPTKEYGWVRQWLREHGEFPENLIVRPCSPMIDSMPPPGFRHTSTVVTEGHNCPADQQGDRCLGCRACWDPAVPNIAYPFKKRGG